MSKFIKITLFTLVCICININNKTFACDEVPIPYFYSDPNIHTIFMRLDESILFTNNSYDPDDCCFPVPAIPSLV